MGFLGLHCHDERSNFRGRDALVKTEELIDYALELGHKGVAITNHETISSCLKANKYWSKLRKEGNKEFKIINGNEIYLCKNKDGDEKPTIFPHFILLAKDRRGYEQLCELSTRAWVNNSFMNVMMRVPTYYNDLYEVIGDDKGHLVFSTACLGSTLSRMLLMYKDSEDETIWRKCIAWINRMKNLSGEGNFFLELQPSDSEEQVYVNNKLIELSKETSTDYIITTDVHYLKKEDQKAHSTFLKAQNTEREVDSFYATTYLMSEEEIHDYMDKYIGYDAVQKGIDNTMLIYDMCEYYDLTKPLHIPYIPLNTKEPMQDDVFYDKVPLLKELKDSQYDSDRHMVREIVKAMHENKKLQDEEHYKLIETCLQTLIDSSEKMKVRWSAYLLQIADYVNIAWEKAGAIVGAGRGSGVGFILNYILDIIQIDPLRENTKTFHWRFLNPERASVLDIDVDVPSSKRDAVIKALKDTYGCDRVSQVLTLNTEGSRSAIQTAARGLEVNDDEATYLASLIISDRGQQRTLQQMYYGNEDFKPDAQFRKEMDSRPDLWEAAQKIEGVINGAGSHAGGVIIVDEPFTKTTGLMRTNSGAIITQYDLHECEDVSLIKVDLLATEALDKIQVCLDLLLKNNKIQDKGSLKETYEECIGIYNLERNAQDMWKMLWNHEIISLFQMEKESGIKALSLAEPHSVDDLATINSVLRLMAQEEGAEQPLNKYARFRKDIVLWYKEMEEAGLTQEEQDILKEILGVSCGICEAQEYLVLLTMHPKIGGFSLAWGDRLRKAVAKKKPKDFKKLEEEFFENANKKGLSMKLCNYVWYTLIYTQRGYGFNKAHTLSYSLIALQEMNLCYKYPIIYWNTANLIVDSGGLEEGTKKKTTNYGKIAASISRIKQAGTEVSPPDINHAKFGFSPDEENNRIIFGLKGINGIGDDIAKAITTYQPYSSFEDFLTKMEEYKSKAKENKFGNSAVITLIKAGSFDELECKPREEIMEYYIRKISKPLENLTMDTIPILIKLGIMDTNHYDFERRLYNFRKYIFQKKFLAKQKGKSANTQYFKLNKGRTEEFFYENFETNMKEDVDYEFDEEGNILVKRGSIDREFKKQMKGFNNTVLKDKEILKQVNDYRFKELWKEKVSGNRDKWAMDSLSYYPEHHELEFVDTDRYYIKSFKDLSKTPVVSEYRKWRGKEIPRFSLDMICGTILDKDKNKNTITLLTPDSGVVLVKFQRGQFAFYNSRLSELNEKGEKTVLEESWMTRGNLCLVAGYRREDQFVAKKYADSVYKHCLQLITEVKEDGSIVIVSERANQEE